MFLPALVRVLTGSRGQDACYFYSRISGSDVRWVSYHFHAEPEITIADDEVVALLADLAPRGLASVQAPDSLSQPKVDLARRSKDKTIWSLLEECVNQLDEPFRRGEIVDWFRRCHPDVNEATLSAHIQAATSNATNRAQNNALGNRPPLIQRIDRGLYARAASETAARGQHAKRDHRAQDPSVRVDQTVDECIRRIEGFGSPHVRDAATGLLKLGYVLVAPTARASGKTPPPYLRFHDPARPGAAVGYLTTKNISFTRDRTLLEREPGGRVIPSTGEVAFSHMTGAQGGLKIAARLKVSTPSL